MLGGAGSGGRRSGAACLIARVAIDVVVLTGVREPSEQFLVLSERERNLRAMCGLGGGVGRVGALPHGRCPPGGLLAWCVDLELRSAGPVGLVRWADELEEAEQQQSSAVPSQIPPNFSRNLPRAVRIARTRKETRIH
jgi:hypothetical protein